MVLCVSTQMHLPWCACVCRSEDSAVESAHSITVLWVIGTKPQVTRLCLHLLSYCSGPATNSPQYSVGQ